MIWLSIVWGIFTIVFVTLGCFHWKMAGKNVSYLQVEQLLPEGITVKVVTAGIDIQEFMAKFNKYIDYYNMTTKKQNKAQAFGYWIASCAAILSCIITLLA